MACLNNASIQCLLHYDYNYKLFTQQVNMWVKSLQCVIVWYFEKAVSDY